MIKTKIHIKTKKMSLFSYNKKLKYLETLRQNIKKRRILIDESKDSFGMDSMTQLIKVKNTSEVKGYPFKLTKSSVEIGAKVVPIETKYEKLEHPCYIENIVLKELTENILLKNISPHITYYLGTQKISNKCRALKKINLKRLEVENKIKTTSNILISEFVNGGSLDNWVYKIHENDQKIPDVQWKSIVFGLIYTIAIMQGHYKMMHNDFHYGNILIDTSIKPRGYFVYEIYGEKYYIPNTGVVPKVWDFEFCMVYSDKITGLYPNKFIIGPYDYDKKNHKTIIDEEIRKERGVEEDNVPFNYNEYYDLHYLLTSLLDLYISQDLFDWIISLYPPELIPEEDSTNGSTSGSKLDDSMSSVTSLSSLSDLDSSISSISSGSSGSSSFSISSSNIINDENLYLENGRIINGKETGFKLPNPKDLITSEYFKDFKKIPVDFDESTSVYFKSGLN